MPTKIVPERDTCCESRRWARIRRQSPRSLFLTVFPSIMLPMFLAVADQTIVATALPTIASDFGEIRARLLGCGFLSDR